jgi:hypothetical protein
MAGTQAEYCRQLAFRNHDLQEAKNANDLTRQQQIVRRFDNWVKTYYPQGISATGC